MILIEIGEDYIRLALCEKKRGKTVIQSSETFSVPGLSENGYLKEEKEAAEVLKLYRKKNKVRSKNAAALIHTGETVAKVVNLSNVPADEIPSAVENNMESYFPIDLRSYASAYKVLGGHNVLLAAIPDALIWDYVNFFASMGLKLIHNDTVAALIAPLGGSAKSCAVIWREAAVLFICYFEAGLMQSIRRIPAEPEAALSELKRLESFYGIHSSLTKAVFIYDDMGEIAEYFRGMKVETEVIRDEYALVRLLGAGRERTSALHF